MAGTLQQRIDSLKSKAHLLTERYAALADAKRTADERIAELEATLRKRDNEISILRQQVEHLQVVTTIAPRREDVERSRAFLAELVRDIDKCINELSE